MFAIICASRLREFNTSNSSRLVRSRVKSWTTVIPASDSERYAFTAASRSRICRYTTRARTRKRLMNSSSGGIAISAHSARCGLLAHMMTTIPVIVITSTNTVSAPDANMSLIASMSVVMRLTSLPTGVRSKNDIGSRSTWLKTASRKSDSEYCATIIVR